jgi:hypothetical protein
MVITSGANTRIWMVLSQHTPAGIEKISEKSYPTHLGSRQDSNFLNTSLQCCPHFNTAIMNRRIRKTRTEEGEDKE